MVLTFIFLLTSTVRALAARSQPGWLTGARHCPAPCPAAAQDCPGALCCREPCTPRPCMASLPPSESLCGLTQCDALAQIIVVFLPLWEAREVFYALVGRERRPTQDPVDIVPDPKAAHWDDSAHGALTNGDAKKPLV